MMAYPTLDTGRVSRQGRSHRFGFTLVELLVVIGIIALLISVLLPALTKARQAASKVKCSAQLRNLGQAVVIYANANRGKMPQHRVNGQSWMWDIPVETRDQLVKCGAARSAWYCPDFPEQDADKLWNFNGSYTVVGYFFMTTRIDMNYKPYVGTQPTREWNDLDFYGTRHYIDSTRPSIPSALKAKGAPTNASEIELAADAIIRQNNRWSAKGGWEGIHVSSHIRDGMPTGSNILYLDGHVAWRMFKYENATKAGEIRLRATTLNPLNPGSGPVQFWF